MDSVPSYRPASVPPPVIPSTPSHDDHFFSGPALIFIGLVLGATGVYLFLNTSLSLLVEKNTKPEEKQMAMEAAKQQVIAEGRPAVSASEKIEYLRLLQKESDAKAAADASGGVVAETSDTPQPLSSAEYNEFMDHVKAENAAFEAAAVAEAQALEKQSQ